MRHVFLTCRRQRHGEGEALIRALLANWERFLHENETIDPLVRMAAAHYQFVAIHPFTDGNGRTGRVVNSLFLVEQGLLPLPIPHLSRYIIANKSDYRRLLFAVTREAALEPWLLFMLREQAFGKEKLFVHPKLMNLLTRDANAFQPYR